MCLRGISPSLLLLLSLLTRNRISDTPSNTPAITIAQLIQFNIAQKPKCSSSSSTTHRHNKDTETPLAHIYRTIIAFSQTRSRFLIDRLHNPGICISYDRLLSISTSLGNAVCKQFENEGLVCPPLLKQNVFTTHAGETLATIRARELRRNRGTEQLYQQHNIKHSLLFQKMELFVLLIKNLTY